MRQWRRPSLATEEPGERYPLTEEFVSGPATPASLLVLHALLDRFWATIDREATSVHPSAEQRARFATATIEIGGNIVRHAYDEDAPGPLALALRAWPDRLEAAFTDHGRPYAPRPAAPPTPLDEVQIDRLPEGGFGLALVRDALDALDYTRTDDGLNRWMLISRL